MSQERAIDSLRETLGAMSARLEMIADRGLQPHDLGRLEELRQRALGACDRLDPYAGTVFIDIDGDPLDGYGGSL